LVDLDLSAVEEARARVPSLSNARPFSPPPTLPLAAAAE